LLGPPLGKTFVEQPREKLHQEGRKILEEEISRFGKRSGPVSRRQLWPKNPKSKKVTGKYSVGSVGSLQHRLRKKWTFWKAGGPRMDELFRNRKISADG